MEQREHRASDRVLVPNETSVRMLNGQSGHRYAALHLLIHHSVEARVVVVAEVFHVTFRGELLQASYEEEASAGARNDDRIFRCVPHFSLSCFFVLFTMVRTTACTD